MYYQLEDDGNVAYLLTPRETWVLASLASIGLGVTMDEFEVPFLIQLRDSIFILDTLQLEQLELEDHRDHAHTEEELKHIAEAVRNEVRRLKQESGLD